MMSQKVEEVGPVSDDRIYVKFSDGAQPFIPGEYDGYDDDEEQTDPNWLKVVECMAGDSIMSGQMALEEDLSEWKLDIEVAVENIIDEIGEIEKEDQARALIHYLATEESVYADEEMSPIAIENEQIQLFSGDLDTIAKQGNITEIFNVIGLVNATIESLNDYLSEADEIAETMEDLSNEIEEEELFEAAEKVEKRKRELKNLGEGEGYPTMDELSENEQEKAERLITQLEFYEWVEEIDLGFAESIVEADFEGYHEFLEDNQRMWKKLKLDLQEVISKLRKGEKIEHINDIQNRVTLAISSVVDEQKKMQTAQSTTDTAKDLDQKLDALREQETDMDEDETWGRKEMDEEFMDEDVIPNE